MFLIKRKENEGRKRKKKERRKGERKMSVKKENHEQRCTMYMYIVYTVHVFIFQILEQEG